MFRCEVCNAASKPGQRCIKVLVQAENKEYPRRSKANAGYKDTSEENKGKSVYIGSEDPGGKGWEIKKEVKVIGCEECVGNGKPCPNPKYGVK